MADQRNNASPHTDDTEDQKKSLRRSWKSSGPVAKLTVVFAGIAALSTSIYAIVAFGQLEKMGGQLDVMQSDRRPWVGIRGAIVPQNITVDQEATLGVTLANFGKSPAFLKKVVTEIRVIEGDFPDTMTFIKPRPSRYEKEREPLFPGDAGFTEMLTYTISKTDADKVFNRQSNVYLFGEILYVFADDPQIHTTHFCYWIGSFKTQVVTVGCHSPWVFAD